MRFLNFDPSGIASPGQYARLQGRVLRRGPWKWLAVIEGRKCSSGPCLPGFVQGLMVSQLIFLSLHFREWWRIYRPKCDITPRLGKRRGGFGGNSVRRYVVKTILLGVLVMAGIPAVVFDPFGQVFGP